MAEPSYSHSELAQAVRNHAMPLEALRYEITPAGLHFLLIHFDIPDLEADTWSLTIGGAVERPLTVTLDDLRSCEARTEVVTMECSGNGRVFLDPPVAGQQWLLGAVGNAQWTGTPLWPLLEEAGLEPRSVEVLFTGADRGIEDGIERTYQRSLTVEEVKRPEVMLVYAMNGQPLLPQHGAPVRLVVPGWYGMASVKWLTTIEAISEPFTGYHQTNAYVVRPGGDEPDVPSTRILPRSLMIPPGVPDSDTRERIVDVGMCEITGRAWCGTSEIVRVEFSDNGGDTWTEAQVESTAHRYGWQKWTHVWVCDRPGPYILSSRATDTTGRSQPDQSAWNERGYENNGIERVAIIVR